VEKCVLPSKVESRLSSRGRFYVLSPSGSLGDTGDGARHLSPAPDMRPSGPACSGSEKCAECEPVFGETLYLRMHRIHSGRQTFKVAVPRKPSDAGIAPYVVLIDTEPFDGVGKVEIQG
jgi:hypothetical protein